MKKCVVSWDSSLKRPKWLFFCKPKFFFNKVVASLNLENTKISSTPISPGYYKEDILKWNVGK